MTDHLNPIAPNVSLASQLRVKSRNRREGQERMALASAAQGRRNDLLSESFDPPPESCVSLIQLTCGRLLPRSAFLVSAFRSLSAAATSSLTARRATRRRSNWASISPVRTHRASEPGRTARARLAANRLAEKGQWDLDALKIEFEELILLDAPIETTGSLRPKSIMSCLLSRRWLEQGPLEPDPATAVARLAIFSNSVPIASFAVMRPILRFSLDCWKATRPPVPS